jgi:protein TonB
VPKNGLDPTLYVSNFNGPIIKQNITPNFGTEDGDARPIVRVEPKYPIVAAQEGLEGWVHLSFSITSSGTVSKIQVIEAQPKRVFNQAAKRALAKWKYKPNIFAGKAQVQDGMMVMLDFKLAD